MDFGLRNKVVVVTGAAKGIGEVTALTFASEGCATVVADLDGPGSERVARRITDTTGADVIGIQLDVTKEESCARLVSTVVERYGRLDVLVNNAGMVESAPAEEMKRESFERQLQVNLSGVFLMCQSALPYLKKAGKSSIINVASIGAKRPAPGGAGYGSAKAGVAMLTLVLAQEWAQYGLRVNAVAPYAINTEFMRPFFVKNKQEFIDKIPLGRVGEPEDVANAIMFLASERASFITGEILDINGGAFMTIG